MPRPGYDLSNLAPEDRPGRRAQDQEAEGAQQPAGSPGTASAPNNPPARQQTRNLPTVRLSPGYITNSGNYRTYNNVTGRGWVTGSGSARPGTTSTANPDPEDQEQSSSSSRAAEGSASSVLADEASRVASSAAAARPAGPRPLPPARANPGSASGLGLAPPPWSRAANPGLARPAQAHAHAQRAPTLGGYLAPPSARRPSRQQGHHGGGVARRRAREATMTTTVVPGGGSASASASSSGTSTPALVVTAPSSSDEEMMDE